MPILTAPEPYKGHLTLVEQDPRAAAAGGQSVLHATAVNYGPGKAGAFTLTVTLPEGVTAKGDFFPKACTVSTDGHTVNCPFKAGLPLHHNASAKVPLEIDPKAVAGTLTGQLSLSSPDDPDATGHTTSFPIQITG
ncbi:hypothetical protein [Kitasatospora sp. LaBMicrA B282]|uniref:hypothetical protein n=1 Tax=Kitasatospora sp. LaBMicrA B282 TaxID=3420949 RepID=UPI003D0D22C6